MSISSGATAFTLEIIENTATVEVVENTVTVSGSDAITVELAENPLTVVVQESPIKLDVVSDQPIVISAVEKGDDGVGVPAGGTAGQVLTKQSSTDFDTDWEDAAAGGGSGTLNTIKYSGTPLGDADITTLDFSTDFLLTESPDKEVNVSFDFSRNNTWSGHNSFVEAPTGTTPSTATLSINPSSASPNADLLWVGKNDTPILHIDEDGDISHSGGFSVSFLGGNVEFSTFGFPSEHRLGGNVKIGNGGAGQDYRLTFDGENNDGVLTWMEDEDYFAFSDDVLLNTTENLYFRDTALSIHSSADGQLDIDADTEIEITAPAVDVNGTLDVSGNVTLGGTIQLNGIDYTWPGADGANGQVLTTDGAGTLSWATAAGGSSLWTDSGTTTYLTTTTDDVVIGATSPWDGAKLSVVGDTNQPQFIVVANATQTSSLVRFENSSGAGVFSVNKDGDTIVNNLKIGRDIEGEDYLLRFDGRHNDLLQYWLENESVLAMHGDGAVGRAHLRLMKSQAASVPGSQDDETLLTITGADTSDGAAKMALISGSQGESTIYFGNNDLEFSGKITYTSKSTTMSFHVKSQPTAAMTLDGGGLDVAASVFAGTGVRVGVNNTAHEIDDASSGSSSATLYIGNETIDTTPLSDARVKENVVDTMLDLYDLLDLRVVDFNYINTMVDRTGMHHGLIAQEVDAVYPYAVEQDTSPENALGGEALYRVQYDRLIPLLIKSVQQLAARVETLEQQQGGA